VLFLSLTGHGFTADCEFVCHLLPIASPDDLAATSLALEDLLDTIRSDEVSGRRVSSTPARGRAPSRGPKEAMRRAFPEGGPLALFSRRARQMRRSHAAPLLRQRVWSYHLIEAFAGRATAGTGPPHADHRGLAPTLPRPGSAANLAQGVRPAPLPRRRPPTGRSAPTFCSRTSAPS